MVKIGMIVGLNLEFAHTQWCEDFLLSKVQYKDKIFEIRKDRVYERDMALRCMADHATMSDREVVN